MHERTEEHSVRTDRHEFQFLIELVLQGAGLVNRNMRCERVGILDVHILYRLEIKLPYIETGAVHGLQFPVYLFEIVARRPLVLVAGQDQQILCTGECRVVEPPEIKIFRDIIRLKGRTLDVSVLNLHHKVIGIFPRHIRQGINQHNRELHTLGLVNRQERNTAARCVLRIVLILCDAAVEEQTEIQIKEHLGILIDTALALVLHGVKDVYPVEVLKLPDNLCQLGEVSCRPDIHHSHVHLGIKDSRERLELEKLIHESTVGVVRSAGQADMDFPSAPYPLEELCVIRLCEVFVRCHDAVSVVGYMFRLEEGVFAVLQSLNIEREHKHKASECKPYLVTLEKHIRARRVDIDVVFFQKSGKSRNLRMLHGIEDERNLVIVRELP